MFFARKKADLVLVLQILLILAKIFFQVMPNTKTNKKRVVVKLQNMPEELQEAVRKQYPAGFTDHMMRIDKGPGDFFYAVVFETEDTNYLVKIDVNVDGQIEDDDEKDYYNDDIKGADELADSPDEETDDED